MTDFIPVTIQARIDAFLKHKRTGVISLNVNGGKIESADLREHIRSTTARTLSLVVEKPPLV